MAKKLQYVWLLKPGKPFVNRKALCKQLGIKNGIYTAASSDAPAWLQDALHVLSDVADILEPDLDSGQYTLLSFPSTAGTSNAMLMARMQYSARLHTHYWLEPSSLQRTVDLIDYYGQLMHSSHHAELSYELHVPVAATLTGGPNPTAALHAVQTKADAMYGAIFAANDGLLDIAKSRLKGLVQRDIANPSLFIVTP